MVGYYKQCWSAFKGIVTFTTSVWWFMLFVILIMIYNQLPMHLIVPSVAILIFYSVYIWYYTETLTPMEKDYVDVNDIMLTDNVRRSCEALDYKWRELGSPSNMISHLDMIQFVYSMRSWRDRFPKAYQRLIDLADHFCESPSDDNAEDLFRFFQRAFGTYPQFDDAFDMLQTIATSISFEK